MQLHAAGGSAVYALHQQTGNPQAIQHCLHGTGVCLAGPFPFDQCAVGGADEAGVCRRAGILQPIGHRLGDLVVDIGDLFGHAIHAIVDAKVLCAVYDAGYLFLICAEGAVYIPFALKSGGEVVCPPPGAKIGVVNAGSVPGHSQGEGGKVHIKNVRVIKIESIPGGAHPLQQAGIASGVGLDVRLGEIPFFGQIQLAVPGLEQVFLVHLFHGLVEGLFPVCKLIVEIVGCGGCRLRLHRGIGEGCAQKWQDQNRRQKERNSLFQISALGCCHVVPPWPAFAVVF